MSGLPQWFLWQIGPIRWFYWQVPTKGVPLTGGLIGRGYLKSAQHWGCLLCSPGGSNGRWPAWGNSTSECRWTLPPGQPNKGFVVLPTEGLKLPQTAPKSSVTIAHWGDLCLSAFMVCYIFHLMGCFIHPLGFLLLSRVLFAGCMPRIPLLGGPGSHFEVWR